MGPCYSLTLLWYNFSGCTRTNLQTFPSLSSMLILRDMSCCLLRDRTARFRYIESWNREHSYFDEGRAGSLYEGPIQPYPTNINYVTNR